MKNHRRPIVWAIVLLSLLAFAATPVQAAAAPRDLTAADQVLLPPLPEWPIIGPILRMLGVVPQPQPPVTPIPTPDVSLPEYRIHTLDDLNQLKDVQPGQQVRILASQSDVNLMAQQIITDEAGDNATVHVSFGSDLMYISARGSSDLVRKFGVELPPIFGSTLNVSSTLRLSAANCQPVVSVQRLSVNGFSAGLRALAQRSINSQLPGIWPSEICVEQVFLTPDEIVVEGYRVP